jgi:hypothetical protein
VKKETDDLLQLLSQFKAASVDQNCFKRSMHSAKTAFKIHRKREEVEDRRKKLPLVNGQLATALLSVQRYGSRRMFPSRLHRQLTCSSRDQHEATSKELQLLQQNVHSGTKDVLAAVSEARAELRTILDKHEEKRQASLRAVVSSLGFADLHSRQSSIHDAYSDTYRWALTQDTRGLATWLRTGSDIYWVSGKAGSGKSTFMKFLGNDQRTQDLLNQWSGDRRRLIVVNCYFWYLGSELQKSIHGLMRTILYQILSSYPSVVELLFPARYDLARKGSTMFPCWTRDELQTALENVCRVMCETFPGSPPPAFCLFIDGLDEYSGNHSELLKSLYRLVEDGNTKLCVSSRPWNVFINAFETRTLQLCLHEFTESDIRHYVESNLNVRIASSSPDDHMACIANDIVTRAEGVFLWVYLVVHSVKRGLEENDEPSDLRERVRDFPTDLEEFFDTILDRVDNFYSEQTAQALMLAYLFAEGHDLAAEQSSYLDFELLGRQRVGLHNTEYLWTATSRNLDSEEYLTLAKYTQRFLSATCKDLLVINLPRGTVQVQACAADPSILKVQFLHRTVFEYLKSSGRMRKLERKVPPCFNDGSVFHILNMGKLKLSRYRQGIAYSPYFTRQASFSLDHAWQGLDIRFIDESQRCRSWHQSDPCLSIAAAYIAFEQFGTFLRVYALPGPQQLLAQDNYATYSNLHVDKSHRLWRTTKVSRHLEPLLTASLGMSQCRTFPPVNINVVVLGMVLDTDEVALPSSSQAISRFLDSALPPLLKECEMVSTNTEAWDRFFGSRNMTQMYDVIQTIGYSTNTNMSLITVGCPMVYQRSCDVVWKFLTTRWSEWKAPHERSPSEDISTSRSTIPQSANTPSTDIHIAPTNYGAGDRDRATQFLTPGPRAHSAFNPLTAADDESELQRFALQIQRLQEADLVTPVGHKRKRPREEIASEANSNYRPYQGSIHFAVRSINS